MLLAIDIGNSNINLGIWANDVLHHEWRLQTVSNRTVDEYSILVRGLLEQNGFSNTVQGTVIASVVPSLTKTFIDICHTSLQCDPLIVNAQLELGMQMHVDNIHEVGPDRIVNAVAGYALCRQACIIVDMGTATTFDVVSKTGDFLGGAIAPGLNLAAQALTSQAARLSQVPLSAPNHAIAKNTVHAVQSGLIYGYVALVEGMIQRLIEEHPDKKSKIKILGTGGLINQIDQHTGLFDLIDPTLTLLGLRLIYERSSQTQ